MQDALYTAFIYYCLCTVAMRDRQSGKNITIDDIGDTIKTWLHHAGDRLNNRKKENVRKTDRP